MRPRTGSFRLICVDCRRKRPANVRRSLLGTPVVLVGDPGTSFRSSCATRLLLPRGPVIERTHILLNRLWGSDRDPYLGNARRHGEDFQSSPRAGGKLQEIVDPALVLGGDRDEWITLDLMVSLYRALPNAELAVCPQADHFGPVMPERAGVFAGMIRDFAGRHAQAR